MWINDADCDAGLGIIRRVSNGAVVFLPSSLKATQWVAFFFPSELIPLQLWPANRGDKSTRTYYSQGA
jgi:hypothetical protein